MRVKKSKQPPPAPTASAVGPCPTLIQTRRTPRTWKFIQDHLTTRPPPQRGRKRREKIEESKNVQFLLSSKESKPPAPTASAIGPCPTVTQIVGRPGIGSLPRTIAPPDHPLDLTKLNFIIQSNLFYKRKYSNWFNRVKKLFQTIDMVEP